MKEKNEEIARYHELVKRHEPRSNTLLNCTKAFIVGGIICCIGQGFFNLYLKFFSESEASTLTSITMIFWGAFLTGIGVYDRIGKFAGAGSIVPITGFANSIVSPAVEFKKEGYIFGVGAKMFLIAGPVLVYGITSSIIIGLIYFLIKLKA
ncbi:stage V sporulation protein AC [Caldicellulosiruptoraceae bacterium PP1]